MNWMPASEFVPESFETVILLPVDDVVPVVAYWNNILNVWRISSSRFVPVTSTEMPAYIRPADVAFVARIKLP